MQDKIKEKTQTKKVPKLRFPDFFGEWKEKKLSEISKPYNGLTGKSGEDFGTGQPFITYKQIFDSSEIDVEKFAFVKVAEKEKQNKAKFGDVFFTTSSETPHEVGFASVLLDNNVTPYLNSFSFGLRANSLKELDPYFLKFFFRNSVYRREVVKLAQGSTRYNISKLEFMKMKFLFPVFLEQQKIVGFLLALDGLIENFKKQKENFEIYKKGMMQKIFSQEIGFKDDNGKSFPKWEEKKLGDVCDYKNGGAFENNLVENGKYSLINLNSIDINGKLKDIHKTVGHADWYLKKDDLVMVLSDVAHGYFLGLVDIIPENDKYVLNQRMGLLRKKDNDVDLNFLRIYINRQQRYFKLHGQGSSQQNLSKGDILKFKIPMPQLEEQQKIADFLTSIDKIIESKQQQITQAEAWKRGLMQGLFV